MLQKAYNLLCIFFANKEIARRSDPDDPSAPLRSLEGMFFESEASRLLIEMAVAMRVIDDQMHRLPADAPERIDYERKKESAKDYEWGLFDDLNLDLRKICNRGDNCQERRARCRRGGRSLIAAPQERIELPRRGSRRAPLSITATMPGTSSSSSPWRAMSIGARYNREFFCIRNDIEMNSAEPTLPSSRTSRTRQSLSEYILNNSACGTTCISI